MGDHGPFSGPSFRQKGFVLSKGIYTTGIDIAGAATTLISINDRGEISGYYTPDGGITLHGLLLGR